MPALNRRQTCPITRHESEQLLDFFLSIPTSPKVREKPITNDDSNNNEHIDECTCEGGVRPEFKRSDSYRKATQKFSVGDVVEMTMTFKKEEYDRQKYMSLPIDIKSRIKPDKKKSSVAKKNKLNRQKSGTVPSSDSDCPANTNENRKKKSVFQRTKERFIFKLWKDKKHHNERGENKISNQEKSTERTTNFGKHEVTPGIDSTRVQVNTTSNDAAIIEPNRRSIKTDTEEPNKTPAIHQSTTPGNMAPNSRSPARGMRYRTQVSREEVTSMFEKILSSAEVQDEPFKFPSSPQSRMNKRKDFSPSKDMSFADGLKSKRAGLRLDIVPFTPALRTETHVTVESKSIKTSVDEDGHTKTVVTEKTIIKRSISLEVDGDDEVDGPQSGHCAERSIEEPLSSEEQERMIEEIARRLNKIADDCVQRMGSGENQTEQAAAAEPLLSPKSHSKKLANDLVLELRKEGDRLSREMNLPDNLLPIVMDMVKKITYDHFKELVKKALCETIGWDQVALYFYVSKAAILMAGAGARILKQMVVQYFHEEISPWISDNGGLETMLEETDSEVD